MQKHQTKSARVGGIKLAGLVAILQLLQLAAVDAGDATTIRIDRKGARANFFAGKTASFAFELVTPDAGSGSLQWSLVLAGAVIARGEKRIDFKAEAKTEVSWDVEIPTVREGVIADAVLTIELRPRPGSPPFETLKSRWPLLIASPEQVAQRVEWLKQREIVLFDPAEKTADVFDRNQIPYQSASEPQCGQVSPGLIVYGEGIDGEKLDAVWQAATETAAAGRRVLVMSSPGAAIPTETLLSPQHDVVESVSLRRSDIIKQWDKRWDTVDWKVPGRSATSSLHWTARGEAPLVEFRNDRDGWHWLDVRYRNGGRLFWTGFGIVESWEATPTARLVFLKILEELNLDKPLKQQEGT